MANTAKMIDGVMRSCNLAEADRELVEQAAIDNCLSLLGNYDWSFLRGESSTTSTADTDTYTLTGASNDAGHIEYIEYNSIPIDFLTDARFDEIKVGSDSTLGTVGWRNAGTNSRRFPKIQLIYAPSEDGKSIYYRYVKQIDLADPFDLLPVDMIAIVRQMLMVEFADAQKAVNASFRERRLTAAALWRYRIIAKPVLPYTIDSEKRRRNAEINLYRGYARRFSSGILRRN